MSYVYALNLEQKGYQIISENDFVEVFAEIETIVNGKPDVPIEEGIVITQKASTQANTKDTGGRNSL